MIKDTTDLQHYLKDILGKYEFLTYKEIAETFDINQQTLYNDRSKGKLNPMTNKKGNVRFSSSDLFSYLLEKGLMPLN